jgi:hypothetical protein
MVDKHILKSFKDYLSKGSNCSLSSLAAIIMSANGAITCKIHVKLSATEAESVFCARLLHAVGVVPRRCTAKKPITSNGFSGKGFQACRPLDPPPAPHETIFNKESLQKVDCRLVYSSPDHAKERQQSDIMLVLVVVEW